MSISFINNFLLIIFVLVFLMGFYVWKSNKTEPLNQSFGIFSFLAGCWVFLNYLWGFFQTSELILTATYAIAPFIITSMFVWTNYIFRKNFSDKLANLVIVSTMCDLFFLFIGFFGNGLLVASVKNRFEFSTGPLFSLFSVYFMALIIAFFIFFYLHYRQANKNLKKSLNTIMLGVLSTITIASTVSFVLPSLGYVELAIFDAPSIIFYVTLSAYAILKMQLFDIKIVLTEIMTYFILVLSFIVLFIAKENVHIVFRIVFMALFIYGSRVLVESVQREIKQKEQLEKLTTDLKNMNKKLEELDKMKTEFISVASHELLTPISAIEGYLSMILDEKLVKVEDPKALQYMDSIYKSAKRLARLVTDLLNVSRIEEGRLLVQKSEINALDLINQVVAELKFKAEDAKVQIETDFPPDVNVNIYADSDKIKEVIINVTGNAIKYTPEGGKIKIGYFTLPSSEVEKRFEIMEKNIQEHNQGPVDESLQKAVDQRLRQIVGESQFIIYVKDSGIGLKHDDLSRLFKKFSRVGEWSTRQVQGTGLGLYISKALIEMHHGRIWAESEGENKGSEFFFSLPLLVNKNKVEEIDKQVPQAKNAKPLAKTKEDGR